MYPNGLDRKKQNSQNSEEVFFGVLKVVALLVVCIILGFSVYKLYHKYTRAQRALTDSQAELAKLHTSEARVNQSIDRLSSPEGVEYEVRDKYRVTKESEKIILVIDNAADIQKKDIALEKNIFVKFKEWLYNL